MQNAIVRPNRIRLEVSRKPRANSILLLPRELLLDIVDSLDLGSHSAFSRTCWYLTFHLQRYLFTRSSIDGDYYGAMAYACGSWKLNNVPIIDRALYYGLPSDPNAVIYWGQTGLAVAARKECPDALSYLLEKKVDVDATGETRLTPLAYALEALGKDDIWDSRSGGRCVANITNLLKAGADPTCQLPDSLKDRHNHPVALTVVLDALLDSRLTDDEAEQLIFDLVSRGAEANGFGRRGWSPLEWAVDRNMRTLVDFLLDHGANPNYGSDRGMSFTPLGKAILTDNVPAIHYLISKGANPGPGPGTSLSPIFYAVQQGRNDCVVALLQNGATPNVVETAFDPRGSHQFYLTALSETIVRHRLPVNLHFFSSMLEIFRTLLIANADPNLASVLGTTPLTLALKLRHLPNREFIVEKLLRHFANPNKPDEHQVAPLALCLKAPWREKHDYVSWMDIRLVTLLVQAGADPNSCGPGMANTSPLKMILLDRRAGHCTAFDYSRLLSVVGMDMRVARMPEGLTNPLIPILLKAGAEVTQALLDSVTWW
ncbi:ankyrin [Coniochaeta ligniaria NRRL 30616]|uniref:Ankyrin n=1 Tax=Coniochaeta ligniaria NRRL 30616 TaxID=1408157 RepID=A0A1J7J2Z1_9PEZI|nr:ankyrin [Coniochaeta ligniaria NRRL 30616]